MVCGIQIMANQRVFLSHPELLTSNYHECYPRLHLMHFGCFEKYQKSRSDILPCPMCNMYLSPISYTSYKTLLAYYKNIRSSQNLLSAESPELCLNIFISFLSRSQNLTDDCRAIFYQLHYFNDINIYRKWFCKFFARLLIIPVNLFEMEQLMLKCINLDVFAELSRTIFNFFKIQPPIEFNLNSVLEVSHENFIKFMYIIFENDNVNAEFLKLSYLPRSSLQSACNKFAGKNFKIHALLISLIVQLYGIRKMVSIYDFLCEIIDINLILTNLKTLKNKRHYNEFYYLCETSGLLNKRNFKNNKQLFAALTFVDTALMNETSLTISQMTWFDTELLLRNLHLFPNLRLLTIKKPAKIVNILHWICVQSVNLPKLSKLYLLDVRLMSDEELDFPVEIMFETVQSLILRFVTFDEACIKLFTKALITMRNLEELSICDIKGNSVISSMFNYMIFLPRLETISIEDQSLLMIPTYKMRYLLRGRRKLKVLKINNSFLSTKLLNVILEALGHTKTLRYLSLIGNVFNGDGLEAIARFVHQCVDCTALVVGRQEFKPADYTRFFNVICECAHLQTLKIVPPAAFRLETKLEVLRNLGKMSQLKSVSFVAAALNTVQFNALLASLNGLSGLQTLTLGENALTERSLSALSVACENLGALRHLNVSGNEITVDMADAIGRIVQKCASLEVLLLKNTHLTLQSFQIIAAYFDRAAVLAYVDATSNCFEAADVWQIKQSLSRKNPNLKVHFDDFESQETQNYGCESKKCAIF